MTEAGSSRQTGISLSDSLQEALKCGLSPYTVMADCRGWGHGCCVSSQAMNLRIASLKFLMEKHRGARIKLKTRSEDYILTVLSLS